MGKGERERRESKRKRVSIDIVRKCRESEREREWGYRKEVFIKPHIKKNRKVREGGKEQETRREQKE